MFGWRVGTEPSSPPEWNIPQRCGTHSSARIGRTWRNESLVVTAAKGKKRKILYPHPHDPSPSQNPIFLSILLRRRSPSGLLCRRSPAALPRVSCAAALPLVSYAAALPPLSLLSPAPPLSLISCAAALPRLLCRRSPAALLCRRSPSSPAPPLSVSCVAAYRRGEGLEARGKGAGGLGGGGVGREWRQGVAGSRGGGRFPRRLAGEAEQQAAPATVSRRGGSSTPDGCEVKIRLKCSYFCRLDLKMWCVWCCPILQHVTLMKSCDILFISHAIVNLEKNECICRWAR